LHSDGAIFMTFNSTLVSPRPQAERASKPVISIGVWLMFVFGLNWWAFGFSAFIILTGVRLVLKGSDTFLSTRPAQRIDERQRYLRSRSLYMPEDRRARRRRERQRVTSLPLPQTSR
jgi:hypothetical protein